MSARQNRRARLVLMGFWAPWCAYARAEGMLADDLARRYPGEIDVVHVNVDEQPLCAARYGVQTVPTLVLVEDSRVVGEYRGLAVGDKVRGAVERALRCLRGAAEPPPSDFAIGRPIV